MAPAIAAGSVTGLPIVGAAATAQSVKGTAYKQALDEGYSQSQAYGYSVLAGASEGAIGYLLSGISALGGAVTNAGVNAFLGKIKNAFLRTSLTLGTKMASEGFEEYLQETLDPVFRNMALGENNEFLLYSDNAMYAFVMGAITAGLIESGSVIADSEVKKETINAIDAALSSGELNADQEQQLQTIKEKIIYVAPGGQASYINPNDLAMLPESTGAMENVETNKQQQAIRRSQRRVGTPIPSTPTTGSSVYGVQTENGEIAIP
jgi:hypothetical protein